MKNNNIYIFSNNCGIITFRQGDSIIKIDVPEMTQEEVRGLLRGLSNVLQNVAFYLPNFVDSDEIELP